MNMNNFEVLLLVCVLFSCGKSLEDETVPYTPFAAVRSAEAQKTRGTPRIVDGTPVAACEFPWVATLYIADPNCGNDGVRKSHFCGGSIFDTTTAGNKSWLLTAAHCLDYAVSSIDAYDTFYSGYDCHFHLYADVTRDDADDPNESGYSTIEMKDWKIHEEYNPNITSNDVAVAWSNDQLFIVPVSLKSTTPCCEVDDTLRVIGYGAEYAGGSLTETLEYVDLKFVDYDTCETMLDENYSPANHLRDGMNCAYDSGQDSCQGDSGGPMIQGTANDSPQVGIVSWGYGCASEGQPGIYTDVGYYYDWIMDVQSKVIEGTTTTMAGDIPTTTVAGILETSGTPQSTDDKNSGTKEVTTILSVTFGVILLFFT